MQTARRLSVLFAMFACTQHVIPAGSVLPQVSNSRISPTVLTPTVWAATDGSADIVPPLSASQEVLAQRYQRFKVTLLQLAEFLRASDPARAELLYRAVNKSNEQRIDDQMNRLIDVLKKERLGDAIDNQQELLQQLTILLELLQSENRQDELEREKQRIQELLRDLDRVIGKQSEARNSNQRNRSKPDRDSATERQQREARDAAEQLGKKIEQQDRERSGTKPPQETSTPTPAPPNGESRGDNSKPKEDTPKTPSQSASPPAQGESQPPGQSQAGSPQQNSPQQQTPGKQELDDARKEMERAIEDLQRQAAQEAGEKQDEAIAQLLKAKARLEEILRQMREEEREMKLASLESRLRQMLAQQITVYSGTLAQTQVPATDRSEKHRSRSIELSRQEDLIALEAMKALSLLKSEASSVAVPEALELIQFDMVMIARRLEKNDVAEFTVSLEKETIEGLQELIESLQKEIEKSKEKQKQPQNPGESQQQKKDNSLVGKIAELKMLRALQRRINGRTKRLAELIAGDKARDPDLKRQVRELSARQASLQQATYNIATERTE